MARGRHRRPPYRANGGSLFELSDLGLFLFVLAHPLKVAPLLFHRIEAVVAAVELRLAVEHHARHIVAVGLHEVIMQAAVLILQIGLQDERMDKVELLRGDKQARAARAALTGKVALERAGRRDDAARVVQKALALNRQLHAARFAQQELHVEFLFQTADGLRQARLADVQLLRGL